MKIFKGIIYGILISLISIYLIALEIVFYYWANSKILEPLIKYKFIFNMNIMQSVMSAFILLLTYLSILLYGILPTFIVMFIATYMGIFLYNLFFVYKIKITKK